MNGDDSMINASQNKTKKKPSTHSENRTVERLPDRLSQGAGFVTQIKHAAYSQQHKSLKSYIKDLQKQIKNTQWKQQLILQYNYIPLQTIKQKIQSQKNAYLFKMNNFREQYKKMFQNEQFTQELQNLRQFNLKLKQKMKQYELNIEQHNVKNGILKSQVNQKRKRLKKLVKANMQLSRNLLQKLGVSNTQDLAKLVKSRSQRSIQKRSVYPMENQQFKLGLSKRSQSAKIVKMQYKQSLFGECLDKLSLSIKAMKSSEDIQAGIYLQIMDRKTKQFSNSSNSGKFSHRSTISHALHQRYGQKIHKSQNKHYQNNQFGIEWDTFKQLNWKQIMGVVMVRDPRCLKLRNLFKNKT